MPTQSQGPLFQINELAKFYKIVDSDKSLIEYIIEPSPSADDYTFSEDMFNFIVSCHSEINKEDFIKNCSKATSINESEAKELWNFLISEKLIVEYQPDSIKSDFPKSWKEPYLFLRSVNNYPFLDMGISDAMIVDNEIMKNYDEEENPPPVFQNFNTGKGIRLEFIESIINEGKHVAGGMNLCTLTCILDVSFGARFVTKRTVHDNGYFEMEKIFKSIPSGGGRNPSEAFVIIRECEDISSGVYHYSVEQHTLEYLGAPDKFLNLIPESEKFEVFMLNAPILKRAQWRYRDPRSYRALLIDIGHTLGAVATISHKSNLSAEVISFCKLKKITKELGLNWNLQPCMAVMGIRSRA